MKPESSRPARKRLGKPRAAPTKILPRQPRLDSFFTHALTRQKMIRPNDVEGEAIEPNRRALDVLVAFGIRHVVPLHLGVARQLAADPVALRRLRGMRLDEFLLELMGFERVCLLLTRRFFKSYGKRSQQNDEALWWAFIHLNRALQTASIEVRRIDSVQQLLRDGERAKLVLRLAGISPVPKS